MSQTMTLSEKVLPISTALGLTIKFYNTVTRNIYVKSDFTQLSVTSTHLTVTPN